tara:strand:+ start:2788 stop:3483 length:696 start_codon:yes stop_codon:yes gene_type:complete
MAKKMIKLPEKDSHFPRDSNRYQYKSYLRALELIPKDKRNTALDIGAHVGYWTIAMLEDFKKVYSFEASEENYNCLLENCKNANTYNVAIGESEGLCDLVLEAGNNSGSYRTISGCSIEMRTIDSFKINDVSYIKVDVQGDELKVIKGAAKTIEKFRPVLSVEAIYNKNIDIPLLTFIVKDLGYKLLDVSSKDYIFIPNGYAFPDGYDFRQKRKGLKEIKKHYKILSKFIT